MKTHYLTACLSLSLLSMSALAEEKTLAESIPGGAIAYAETSGLAELIHDVRESELYQSVIASDSTRDFLASNDSKGMRTGITWAQMILRMNLWDAAEKLFGGRAAFALYPKLEGEGNALDGKPDALVLIYPADLQAWSKQRFWTDTLLALGADRIGREQAPPNVKIYETKQDEAPRTFLALHPHWVLISSDSELLQRGVLLLAGDPAAEETSLASEEAHLAQLSARLPGPHLARAFVDTDAISRAAGGRLGLPQKMDNPLASLLFGGMLELVAHSDLTCLALDFDAGEIAVEASLDAGPSELDPRFQVFFAGEEPTRPIPQIPGLIGGLTLHRDLATWYQSRDDLLQAQVLPGFDKFETGIGNLLPGKDIGTDVVPLIGDNFTLVSALQDYGYLEGEPGVKLPGFALILDLAGPDPDAGADMFQLFFQTFLSVLNLQAAEQNRQPWLISMQQHGSTQITYARYIEKPAGEQLPTVFNFLPAAARVGDQFVISSSLGMCKNLVDSLGQPAAEFRRNSYSRVDFAALAELLALNRPHLVASRLNEGRDSEQAAEDIGYLFLALEHLGSLTSTGSADETGFRFKIQATLK